MRMTPKLLQHMDALTNATSGYTNRRGDWIEEPSITRGRAIEVLESIKNIVGDSPSRLNPSLTQKQAWDIFAALGTEGKPEDILRGLIFKNIVAEFWDAIAQAALDAAGRGGK